MNFSDALNYLKQDHKVYRTGWNGKGMWLQIIPKHEVQFFSVDGTNTYAVFEPCIAMFTADSKLQPGWLASQADILAEDWEVDW